MNLKNLRVNGKRLQQTLEDMAKIGATPAGGVQNASPRAGQHGCGCR